jgi:site-specific recombinase XerC
VFKRSSATPAAQQVFLSDIAQRKVEKFISWKRAEGESVLPDAPLFVSRLGHRLATRTVRYLFHQWRVRAGLDCQFSFHALRHTALTNAYRRERDVLLVQRMARHKSVQTTMIYAGPSDQDIEDAARRQPS